ncbi:ATP-binding protein [Bacillus sonorensis]|uniref:ATP-binding protein n=1 Tax=Bacillus sonorensis TaxID=119858 RepID=UPI0004975958|nr:ATP-binding protein [Bacillus sonorensis]MCY7855410.1 ATP-binding protein [Bacillus sonorensis]MCY8032280.1 ATP-binding protein [Bacillus sonorensis]MCY8086965.1 ATP-binding protein [Bacillus sonorensis]MCY8271135.1 ATP-binding protein [Bacillus sonorensis]MCY8564783.1 ATP-binding protein [Bacillus sonorensis]
MRRYQGRIIATVLAMTFIMFWNYLFYGVLGNKINWTVDLLFTLVTLVSVWWLTLYIDESNQLVYKLKESEKQYKELSAETNRIMDNLQEIVFQTDRKGIITFLNQAWTTLTGYSVKESIGTMYNDYFDHEERISNHLIAQLKNREREGRIEVLYHRKNGSKFWGEVHYKLYYTNGQFTGSLGTLTDVTERKNAEMELLKSNQRLAMQSQKLAMAGQLAAGIAHEVRNPLTSVNGFLQLMKTEYPDRSQYFDIIFSEIKRIDSVLGELLVLAKPHQVQFKKIKINSVLQQVTTLLETNAVLAHIEIKKAFEQGKEWEINGDENQIKQVFINLIKNGIEAMPDGGKITISSEQEGDFVKISIKDEGGGISQDDLDKLGEPFFSTKKEGTGLGLTICLNIIGAHNGEMKIDSKLGEGSTFHILLPLDNQMEKAEKTKPYIMPSKMI